jgi:hypothetical protein
VKRLDQPGRTPGRTLARVPTTRRAPRAGARTTPRAHLPRPTAVDEAPARIAGRRRRGRTCRTTSRTRRRDGARCRTDRALVEVVWTAHRARLAEQRLPSRHVEKVVGGVTTDAEGRHRHTCGQPRLERYPPARELRAVVGQHAPDEEIGQHWQVGAALGVGIEERRRGGARRPALAGEHRAVVARGRALGGDGSTQELARPPRVERRQDVGVTALDAHRGPPARPAAPLAAGPPYSASQTVSSCWLR